MWSWAKRISRPMCVHFGLLVSIAMKTNTCAKFTCNVHISGPMRFENKRGTIAYSTYIPTYCILVAYRIERTHYTLYREHTEFIKRNVKHVSCGELRMWTAAPYDLEAIGSVRRKTLGSQYFVHLVNFNSFQFPFNFFEVSILQSVCFRLDATSSRSLLFY